MTDFIDPEELPFTRDEIFRAAQLFLPDDVAAGMADALWQCGPGIIRERRKRRARWRKNGVPGADTMRLYAWCLPDELLPALAALSSDCAHRAMQLNQFTWDGLYRATIHGEQRAIAQAAGMIPTLESLTAADREERKRQGKRPRKLTGIIISSVEGEWPAETDAMRQIATDCVSAAEAKWRDDVEHFVTLLADRTRPVS